ncbi:MAG: prepilin-type N-terminal cleavage/methylation domain-containing protein [Candidatus Sacchiramonaceae bacterium]|nr:prepilin-type N-terminal cleavage/methylation domain-containing protein [Candidatus Saccharimonadaceae bacterium]
MIRDNNHKQGFTLIELMLSMSMVAVLLIAIVTMSMQMGRIYTKGATMFDLNAASRTINTDFTRSFNSIPSIEWRNPQNSFGASQNYVVRPSTSEPQAGAYCTGNFSYLWNTARILNAPAAGRNVPIRYDGAATSSTEIKLIKILDSSRQYCADSALWTRVPRGGQVIDLLPQSESGLMIYDIRFDSKEALRDQSTNQRMVNISYVLGTNDANRGLIDMSNMNCRPPSSAQGMEDYCAINKFDLTVRTLGRR